MALVLDIHSHKIGDFAIKNVILGKENLPETTFCSVGFHPWYLDGFDFEILEKAAALPNVLAIGECGLDAFTPHKNEVGIFEAHVLLANKLKKPLIIHCVKRHNELISIKKRLEKQGNIRVPMIVHGFNNKWAIAENLLKNDFYLSFGAAILNPKSNAAQVLAKMPPDRFFLETDDSDADIQRIYEAAPCAPISFFSLF